MKARQIVFKLTRSISRIFYRKHIWLISDREGMAGDNGEALFRFLQSKEVNAIFAIKKDSEDYDRICKIGKVVDMNSLKYKFLLCVCDCHCSSQLLHMENHKETPQIFLQHGVAYCDISKMIKAVNHKNFYIITASRMESEQIISAGMKESHVWLTGLPRFDYLKNDSKNKIVVAFSWRASFSGKSEDELKETRYFKMLERITKDEELQEEIYRRGYELYIKLHPEYIRYRHFFSETDKCHFYTDSYNRLYEEASLMVTDYSSAISDCVYLHKPIMYFHFDGNQYYDGNPYLSPGIFDFDEHGFGPVIHDYDVLKTEILQSIDNGCKMDEFYKKRVLDFFEFNDLESSARVFKKILEILE